MDFQFYYLNSEKTISINDIKNIKAMKLNYKTIVLMSIFSLIMLAGCNMYTYSPPVMQTSYQNPQWAPPYYEGARYYYLPDIETYYDLSMNEFVFLNNGRWNYSRYLPSIYSGFDLYNCFTVVLNSNVYRPWMHHQYYISHYPRYYYRDYYDHSNYAYVRGFNENRRSAIYWEENERHKARSWDDRNVRENRNFQYSDEDRKQQRIVNDNETRRPVNDGYGRGQSEGENNRATGSTATRTNSTSTPTRSETTGNSSTRTTSTRSTSTGSNESENTRSAGTRSTTISGNNENVNNRVAETRSTTTTTSGNNENVNARVAETSSTTTIRSNNDNNNSEIRTNEDTRRQTSGPSEGGRTQSTNYYGRTIGKPVKVEKQMQEKPAASNTRRTVAQPSTSTSTRSSAGTSTRTSTR